MDQVLAGGRIGLARRRTKHAAQATHHCGNCGETMQGGPLEVLCQFQGWSLGWRKHVCAHCAGTESRVEITRDVHGLQFRTHPIC